MPKTEIERWPALPLADWEETYRTMHMWSQMVGKVRLALAPKINHWWGVPLYVMRASPDPELALLEFFQSTYEAGANLAGWDRSELER